MPETSNENRGCLACAFPFWEQLTADEQELLCRYTRPVKYAKGARVHSPLESCVGILLLRSGQLRAYLLSEDGRDVTLYRLFGGEVCILSASCVMDSVNIDLYIDAEEDTEALCISAGIFRRLMQQNVNELLPEELYSGKIRMTVYLAAAFANGLLVMGLSALYRRYSREGGKSSGTICGTKPSGTIYQLLVKAEK